MLRNAVEIGLRREAGGVRGIDQQPVARRQQLLGEIEAPGADLFMRRRTRRCLEAAGDMRLAHAGHRSEVFNRELAIDRGFDEFGDAR
jgi:hypothetical protein